MPAHKRISLLLGLLVAVSLAGTLSVGCGAKAFPSKPITLVNFSAPGGTNEVFLRQVAKGAEPVLKVSLPVESRAGAGGMTALVHLKAQPADGHTVAYMSITMSYAIVLPEAPVVPSDFQMVSTLASNYSVFLVSAESQFKTLADLVNYAKANPGKVKVAGTGTTGFHPVAMQLWTKAAGVKVAYVPMDGGGPAFTAVLGGHVDATQQSPAGSLPLVREGKLRALAISGPKRTASLPDVPTFKEQGVDSVTANWLGLAVRKDTPSEIVTSLHDAFKNTMVGQEWQDFLMKNAMEEDYKGPQDAQKQWLADVELARAVMKETGQLQ